MYPKVRDLEMVFNLLWTTKSQQSSNHERVSIVGMCDLPSTTLNWETFKSYLLKNSGSNAADVKVSYIGSDEKDIYIYSQAEFQLALYTFRRRARNGEIITLKLEKIVPRETIQLRDLAIQTLNVDCTDDLKKSSCTQFNDHDAETPPKWFKTYMKNYEKTLIAEMSQVFSSLLNAKLNVNCQHTHPTRKAKGESYKRIRKVPLEMPKTILEKDLYKCAKVDSVKCEKSDHKKLKVKKLSANKVSSDSDAGRTFPAKRPLIGLALPDIQIDVGVLGTRQKKLPPMYGGEVYQQWWDIVNTGQSAWTETTLLIYAWGSKELCPVNTVVTCPPLQSGDKGRVGVALKMPETPGSYECYWHFYHMGRRFGNWLGCQVEVVERPYAMSLPEDINFINRVNEEELQISTVDSTQITAAQPGLNNSAQQNDELKEFNFERQQQQEFDNKEFIPKVAANELVSSESDNVSIVSFSGSNNSEKCDYVLVPKSKEDDNIDNDNNDSTPLTTDDQQLKESNVDVLNVLDRPQDEFSYVFVTNKDEEFESPKHEEFESPKHEEDFEINEVNKVNVLNVKQESSITNQDVKVEESVNEDSLSDNSQRAASDFAYVDYQGRRHLFHKSVLDPDYFANAEKPSDNTFRPISPESETQNPEKRENRDHQASSGSGSASSSFSSSYTAAQNRRRKLSSDQNEPETRNRLFVFPRRSPGFEVVFPSTAAEAIDDDDGYSSTHAKKTDNVPTPSSSFQDTKSRAENVISEAALFASNVISKTRNMMDVVKNNGTGKWVNGHWISENENSKRENALRLLTEMGFQDRDMNATLLARYKDDLDRVISDLLQ